MYNNIRETGLRISHRSPSVALDARSKTPTAGFKATPKIPD